MSKLNDLVEIVLQIVGKKPREHDLFLISQIQLGHDSVLFISIYINEF